MALRDWQVPLVDELEAGLRQRRVAVNASTTGSGKTYMALDLARRMGSPLFVIAPKVALTQWRRAAESEGVADRLVDVTNPAQISKPTGCRWYTRNEMWKLPKGTLVVWDEPHLSASGIDSVCSRAMAELKAFGHLLHPMSATLADSPKKMRALGWWYGMHQWNEASFYGWCRQNGCSDRIVRDWTRGTERRVFEFTKNKAEATRIMAELRRQMSPGFVHVGPQDIPGFPEETIELVLMDLSKADRKILDDAYEAMPKRMTESAQSDAGERIRERQRVEFCKAASLAELAYAEIEDGYSVIVFCNFTDARHRVTETLKKLGCPHVGEIYGGQDPVERMAYVDAFQSNSLHAMVVMTQAGGAALSLHDVKKERPRLTFLVPGDDAAAFRQALGRARREGGTNVTQRIVLAANTIEERLKQNLERKLHAIDTLNDGDLEL